MPFLSLCVAACVLSGKSSCASSSSFASCAPGFLFEYSCNEEASWFNPIYLTWLIVTSHYRTFLDLFFIFLWSSHSSVPTELGWKTKLTQCSLESVGKGPVVKEGGRMGGWQEHGIDMGHCLRTHFLQKSFSCWGSQSRVFSIFGGVTFNHTACPVVSTASPASDTERWISIT